jgi:predicted NBD/HSP70 family sugar kinase
MDANKQVLPGTRVLSGQAVVDVSAAQMDLFTTDSLRVAAAGRFMPGQVRPLLSELRGPVAAVDIGGDKLASAWYAPEAGTVTRTGAPSILRSVDGVGYLACLVEIARRASAESVVLGVSFAGPLSGTRILSGMNVGTFVREFTEGYDGDFDRLGSSCRVVNDARAGLVAAALEAESRFPGVRNVLFLINGSGLNAAVLRAGEILTMEAGHVPVTDPVLNPFNQRRPCGMNGATYVCLENVGASRAAVEDVWRQRTGSPVGGRQIAEAARSGNDLASGLYTTAALVTAVMAEGVARAVDLIADWSWTVLVGHGGTFHVPEFAEQVRHRVEGRLGRPARFLTTADFTDNACLDGAAIEALVGGTPDVGEAG